MDALVHERKILRVKRLARSAQEDDGAAGVHELEARAVLAHAERLLLRLVVNLELRAVGRKLGHAVGHRPGDDVGTR